MFRFIALLFILLFIQPLVAQDYTVYYQKMDSASYYLVMNDREQASKLEEQALMNFKGFLDDYENAIRNQYKRNHTLNKEYIKKGFECGMRLQDLFYILKKDSIPYSKHEIKKLKRKFGRKKSLKGMSFLRLLRKDQKARRKGKNFSEADSLNALSLIKLYNKKPWLFNRFETCILGNLLNPLLYHQHWNYIEPLFDELRDHVKKGLIERHTIVYMLERASCLDGYVFTLDSTKNILLASLQLNDTLCDKHQFYSSFGDISQYVRSEKKAFLTPVHPSFSMEKLSELRKFMLLPDINLYRKTNPNTPYLPENEFCEKVKSAFDAPAPTKK